jgi:hypothetical protein
MAMNKQREMRFGVYGRLVSDSTSLSLSDGHTSLSWWSGKIGSRQPTAITYAS